MKSRAVLSALAMGAILALAATPAHAGGAAGAASLDTFLECEAVNGPSAREVVSTFNFDDTLSRANVSVGKAVMRCRQVNVRDSTGAPLVPPTSDEIKCYDANVPGPKGPSELLVLQDAFGADVVRVFPTLKVLCGPAIPTFVP
jgi:hypothetical protein